MQKQAAVTAGCRQLWLGNAVEAAGCGGTHSAKETLEHKVIMAMSWFTEAVKQGKAGRGREAGPQGGKGKGWG